MKLSFLFSTLSAHYISEIISPETRDTLPDFIITGVNKCGTSAASRFLADHPNISKAHGEPNFFNIDENYAKGFAWYSSQFTNTEVETLRFEKTPSYYKSIDAQMRIQKMNPNIKMVLVGMKKSLKLYLTLSHPKTLKFTL